MSNKTNQFVDVVFQHPKKIKYDSNKEREQRSCWIITIMINQSLRDKFMQRECRLPPYPHLLGPLSTPIL